MVLPGHKQTIQKRDTTLGVSQIEYLVDLCKGRKLGKKSRWFYRLFLDRGFYGSPKSTEEVIQKIRDAWWVEEEDIKQQIQLIIHQAHIWESYKSLVIISQHLRQYLIAECRVFSRQTSWVEDYEFLSNDIVEEPRQLGLNLLFNQSVLDIVPTSTYNKYLLYLSCVLKLPRKDMCKVLLESTRQMTRINNVFKEDMEEFNE